MESKKNGTDLSPDTMQPPRVRLVKLTLSTDEMNKLTSTERKRYVMLTSILRDLILLQKHMIFIGNFDSSHQILTSAYAIQILYFITTLGSKLHEAGNFLEKEGMLENVPERLFQARDEVKSFFAEPQAKKILEFIRNKFGFHYDTYRDLDPKIDSAFVALSQVDMWLSASDSGNDLFTSTNDVISEVIYNELQGLGFSGDRKQYVEYLFDLIIQGAKVIAHFGRGYLAECFPVDWQEGEDVELNVPNSSEVSLPLIVSRSSKTRQNDL